MDNVQSAALHEMAGSPHTASPVATTLGRRLQRRVKQLFERSLGLTISRRPRFAPNQYADAAVRGLRRWSADDVVFDVGANDGRTILRIREQLASPRIFAFEPVAATYTTLVQRTAGMPNVRAFRTALGAAPGEAAIYLNDIDAMNSLSPDWTEAPAGVERVAITTVDRVMQEHRIDFVHFLKVDTEGYELEVLKGAEGALKTARIALIQVEVGFDQMLARRFTTLEEVRVHLAPRGYVLYGVYNQCRVAGAAPDMWPLSERTGYTPRVLVYCDALFVRADLTR